MLMNLKTTKSDGKSSYNKFSQKKLRIILFDKNFKIFQKIYKKKLKEKKYDLDAQINHLIKFFKKEDLE